MRSCFVLLHVLLPFLNVDAGASLLNETTNQQQQDGDHLTDPFNSVDSEDMLRAIVFVKKRNYSTSERKKEKVAEPSVTLKGLLRRMWLLSMLTAAHGTPGETAAPQTIKDLPEASEPKVPHHSAHEEHLDWGILHVNIQGWNVIP